MMLVRVCRGNIEVIKERYVASTGGMVYIDDRAETADMNGEECMNRALVEKRTKAKHVREGENRRSQGTDSRSTCEEYNKDTGSKEMMPRATEREVQGTN